MSSDPTSAGADHWQAYWQTADSGSAAVSGEAPGDLFDSHWRAFFEDVLKPGRSCSLLDLACGAGVVLERAIESASLTKQSSLKLLCGVDYAKAAVTAIKGKSAPTGAAITGVAASARALPFPDGCYDLVVSQFGLEYAGLDAFNEAARVLAPEGAVQVITHYKNGGIDRECRANAETLSSILSSDLFETAIATIHGFTHASTEAKFYRIVGDLGALVDGETLSAKLFLAKLLPGAKTLVSRRLAYSQVDALAWLEAMRRETRHYADRMNAMTACALDATNVKSAVERLGAFGASVLAPQPLTPAGRSAPAAWLIKADRPKA